MLGAGSISVNSGPLECLRRFDIAFAACVEDIVLGACTDRARGEQRLLLLVCFLISLPACVRQWVHLIVDRCARINPLQEWRIHWFAILALLDRQACNDALFSEIRHEKPIDVPG